MCVRAVQNGKKGKMAHYPYAHNLDQLNDGKGKGSRQRWKVCYRGKSRGRGSRRKGVEHRDRPGARGISCSSNMFLTRLSFWFACLLHKSRRSRLSKRWTSRMFKVLNIKCRYPQNNNVRITEISFYFIYELVPQKGAVKFHLREITNIIHRFCFSTKDIYTTA